MKQSQDNLIQLENREDQAGKSVLEEILRNGARQLLQAAIENEVAEYIEKHLSEKDENGHRLVTRNGSLPKRSIQTGLGNVEIKQPRVHDRREGESFTSKILPPYMRRVPSIDALVPALYLKGVSTGNMEEALEAILGPNASGLSAANVVRLKEGWAQEYGEWQKRDLSKKNYVYIWADGIYFNVRLDSDRPCILVVMGALEDGSKELIAIHDGHRESKLSWKELLQDMKKRGLKSPPKLAVGDGALGFWAALEEVFSSTKEQRCWVHKTANVLDKMAKKVQGHAKNLIHEMYMAPTREDGLNALESFIDLYQAKYPKACECLVKDKEVLFAFYDFPAEHWSHIRSTNPIESTFATVRHRTRQTKGCGSRKATMMMVFKLAEQAQKHWRKLNGYKLIPKVIEGVKFTNGEIEKPETKAA
jgi:transposase-like protein